MEATKKVRHGKAFKFLQQFKREALEATGHSWTRLNGALRSVLHACITGGVKFAPNDYHSMLNELRGEFWMSDPDWSYRLAIESGNASAWQSIENHLGRKPYILNGQRIHVGLEIRYQGHFCNVTSMNAERIVAKKNGGGKLFKITRDKFKAAIKEKAIAA